MGRRGSGARGPGWMAVALAMGVASSMLLAQPSESPAPPAGVPSSRGAASTEPPPDPAIPPRPRFVTAATEAGIRRGLAALARMQAADGSWASDGRSGSYPCTMTGLSGLAFLTGGHTPTRGEYAAHLRKAVRFMLSKAHADSGLIAEGGRSMYDHGFGTLFLAEVAGMEGDPEQTEKISAVLVKAIELIVRSQSVDGGWYYTPESQSDEGSVTVTQLQALRACMNAGFNVPFKIDREGRQSDVIANAIEYLRICQERDGGICYSKNSRGSRPPLTAAAVATIFYAGAYEHEVAQKALDYCRRYMGPNWNQGHYWYTHFYLSQAFYQSSEADWAKYYPAMRDNILRSQRPDGSWPDGEVGRVFSTAIALVILQLPYQHLPIYQR